MGLAPTLVACSSNETVDDGSIRGTLTVYVATLDDGTTGTEYRLSVGGDANDERLLVFATPPDLTSGVELKVWGATSGREILVSRFDVVDGSGSGDALGSSRESLIDGPALAARSFAYVLVNVNGGGLGTYTEAQATTDVFGTGASDGSTKQWFLEASYGRQDISGDVVGPFNYAMTGCDTSGLVNALRGQVDSAIGGPSQHYLWYMGTRQASCMSGGQVWAGLAEVGSPASPANDTWYNASTSCVVLVQEPAHNFGMQHSSGLRCSGASFAADPRTCTHVEYGDCHDPMGGGCRHTNAWQKAYQGWFGGCNSVRVNSSGTYTLLPLEVECNGIQVLQIPMPVTNRVIDRSGGGGQPTTEPVLYYYLELRTRTGFDTSMTISPTVLVHVGPDYRTFSQGGRHTWLLDMNPSTAPGDSCGGSNTNNWNGMALGQTFTDPAGGVSFTLDAVSATGATISVTTPGTGAPTCAGGGTVTPPGPATCSDSAAGGMGGAGGAGGRGGAGAGGAGAGGRGGAGAGGAGAGGRGGAGAGGAAAGGVSSGGAGAVGGAGNEGGGAGLGGVGAEGGAAGFPGGGSAGDSSAGAAGLVGTAGFPGAGAGPVTTGGAAGTPTTGAGSGGATGLAGSGAAPGEPPTSNSPPGSDVADDTGCGCRLEKAEPRRDASVFFGMLSLVLGSLVRRRRRA